MRNLARALFVLTALSPLIATQARASEAGARAALGAMRPGMQRDAFRDTVSDGYEGPGRLEAVRAMSEQAGVLQESVIDTLRMRALFRDNALRGLDRAQLRAALDRGDPLRLERQVSRVMAMDADGDGRVTQAEFDRGGIAAVTGALAQIRDAVAPTPASRTGYESRAMEAFDAADLDHDGVLSAAEIKAARSRGR